MGGAELEKLVVGVRRYFVEGENLTALHGFAGLGMVVVNGVDMNTLGGVEFVAETAREVAVVHVNHSYRHPLWQPFLHHGGEEEEGEDYAEGEDDEVAGIELDAPQFAEHHSNSGVDVFVLHGAEGVERRELLFGVADDGRHAGTEAVDFFLGNGFDIETLHIVLAIGLGGTPSGVACHRLDFADIASVGLLAESGDVHFDGGAAVDVLKKVFAHGECHPRVAHVEDGNHRGASADEVAHLGIDLDDFAIARGDEVAVVLVALNLCHGTASLIDKGGGGIDILALSAFLGHEILLLGGSAVGLCHFVFGIDLVEFLGGDDAFFIKAFHPVVGFAVNIDGSLGFLPHLVGHLDLLFAGAVLGFLTLCRCSTADCGGLHHLGIDLGAVDVGEGVASFHHVALMDIDLVNTAGDFVADTVFGSIDFAHEYFFLWMDGHQSGQCYNYYQPDDDGEAGE